MGIVLPFKPRAPKLDLNTEGTTTGRISGNTPAVRVDLSNVRVTSHGSGGSWSTRPPPDRRTVHLMTQRDQPYGSVRRCCERCGLMMVNTQHMWTNDEAEYNSLPPVLVRCEDVKKQQPPEGK